MQTLVVVAAIALVAVPMLHDPPCGALCDNAGERHAFFGPEGDFVAISHQGVDLVPGRIEVQEFVEARQLGYRYMETDLRLTTSDQLIAVHNASNARDGEYGEHDGALATDLVGAPELADALWNFEFSAPSDEHTTAFEQLLADHDGLAERVCVHFGRSVDRSKVDAFRSAIAHNHSDLCTCATFTERSTVTDVPAVAWASYLAERAQGRSEQPLHCFVVSDHTADRHDVDQAPDGVIVLSWPALAVLESPERLAEIVDIGFGGAITDHPAELKEILEDRGRWAYD